MQNWIFCFVCSFFVNLSASNKNDKHNEKRVCWFKSKNCIGRRIVSSYKDQPLYVSWTQINFGWIWDHDRFDRVVLYEERITRTCLINLEFYSIIIWDFNQTSKYWIVLNILLKSGTKTNEVLFPTCRCCSLPSQTIKTLPKMPRGCEPGLDCVTLLSLPFPNYWQLDKGSTPRSVDGRTVDV